jgi:RecB family endonuclease NucS
VVAEEYGLFADSRRRIDLLALDRTGTPVVIELKRTDDGGHVRTQRRSNPRHITASKRKAGL